MKKSEREVFAERVTQLVIAFLQGERATSRALAERFNVDIRTIQRDIKRLGQYLPLERSKLGYAVDKSSLQPISPEFFYRMTTNLGVEKSFPQNLTKKQIQQVALEEKETTLLMRPATFTEFTDEGKHFSFLQSAIQKRQRIQFSYRVKNQPKEYSQVEPYLLINQRGVWYLAAIHENKVKTFSLNKIHFISLFGGKFEVDEAVLSSLKSEDSAWVGEAKQRVEIYVDAAVAEYFLRRSLLPNQELLESLDGGALRIKTEIAHANELLPIIRYWIPHVRILEPQSMQTELNTMLQSYLQSF